jgi:hypothetical protein
MKLATLPGHTTKNSQSSSHQPLVIITGNELYAPQASSHQVFKKSAPVDFMLAERG